MIQSFCGFTLIHALGILQERGFLGRLNLGQSIRPKTGDAGAAVSCNLLTIEGWLKCSSEGYRLTPLGENALTAEAQAMTLFLTKGYAAHFAASRQAPGKSKKAPRDSQAVAKASDLIGAARLQPFLESLMNEPHIQTVIDFGCGSGDFIMRMGGRFPQKKFIGIDASNEALKLAKAGNKLSNIKFVKDDLLRPTKTQAQLKDASLVTSFFLFHELIASGSLKKFLRWLKRNLRSTRMLVWEFAPPADLNRLHPFRDLILEQYPIVYPYLLWHALSGQETLDEDGWLKTFKGEGMSVGNVYRFGRLASNLSLFPMFEIHL